jgi:tetrapyrrole methylase family protein/MazG family protein
MQTDTTEIFSNSETGEGPFGAPSPSAGTTSISSASASFERLYSVVSRLRGPGGCPWDLEQTPHSLRPDLLEEAYECVEAIQEGDSAHVCEELGDVFLLATMISYMNEQAGIFSVSDALEGISDKLVRRHPHVFGETSVSNVSEVLENWQKIKVEKEGRAPKESVLDDVSRSLPPLERSYKLQKKAAKAGFDWPDINGVIEKLNEELSEVLQARSVFESATEEKNRENAKRELEGELGDLLFSVVNLCRFLKVDPSLALQGTNARFVSRFSHVEREMKQRGLAMEKGSLDTMEAFWKEAKEKERKENTK